MIARILCFVGWHRWHFHDEPAGPITLTLARCVRQDECPRYGDDMVVNVEPRGPLGRGVCICAKGRWHPQCPVHGREA